MINLNKYLKDEVVSGKAIPDIGNYIGQSFFSITRFGNISCRRYSSY